LRIQLNLYRIRTKVRINLFRITVYFFLTDKCIGILKSLGVRKFCPNNKFPDKSSAGLTRLDCIVKWRITISSRNGTELIKFSIRGRVQNKNISSRPMFRIAKLTQKFFNSRHAVLDTIFCKSMNRDVLGVGGAHPSVFLGWVGASWPRPPKSHRKNKIVKKN
jgi:hypothetical protein